MYILPMRGLFHLVNWCVVNAYVGLLFENKPYNNLASFVHGSNEVGIGQVFFFNKLF